MERKTIGFLGMGKLGKVIAAALAVESRNSVVGFDPDKSNLSHYRHLSSEEGYGRFASFREYLEGAARLTFSDSVAGAIVGAEIVFIAVQTPHSKEYEGISAFPRDGRDFDYSFLRQAVEAAVPNMAPGATLAVISTVLPGTSRREILPILEKYGRSDIEYLYTPSFIAMGTALRDFLRPELVLVGCNENGNGAKRLHEVYTAAGIDAPFFFVSVESAEMAKVAYNTVISQKIALANLIGEACDKIKGADAFEVSSVLRASTRRVASGAYMAPGMGDGGACHPRDNIAMSGLADRLGLHWDPFGASMVARERHAAWIIQVLCQEAEARNLPIAIAGIAYKPESDLAYGSHALLVYNELKTIEKRGGPKCFFFDPFVQDAMAPSEGRISKISNPSVILLGCPHSAVLKMAIPPNSVVIDPGFGFRPKPSFDLVRLGSAGRGEEAPAWK